MTTVAIAKSAPARIAKGKLGVYFAWGAFSKRDGQTFTDAHGDQIPDEELVAGALSLAKSAQLGHEHDGTITGSVPLVMPMPEDVQAALELTSPHAGLVVGFQPSAEFAASLDAGEPWEMSIEGVAMAEPVAKSAGAVEVGKAEHKRTLRSLTINKIDLVRAGAHGAGTRIAIAKRADVAKAGMKCPDCGAAMAEDATTCPDCKLAVKPVAKRAPVLTDATDGHQHLIDDAENPDGFTSWERQPGSEYGHSHPWVRLADGSISIGEAAGHTHTVTTGEATMADDLAKSLAAAQADVTKAEQRTAAVLALPVEQFTFAKRLSSGELAAYLAKSAPERAEAAKPVHVAKSGEVFYASDDPRLVSMAKANDAMVAEVEKARGEAQATAIAKAAAELPALQGAALLVKAAHLLPEAERVEALKHLATHNASIAVVTKTIGSGGAPEGGDDAYTKYESALAAFAKAAGKTPDDAAPEFLSTPTGKAAYAEYAANTKTPRSR